jgi:hypothetical protein
MISIIKNRKKSMKYNHKNYTEAENSFIKKNLSRFTYVKTLGSHTSIKIDDSNGWRQLIFIGFSKKINKSTYIIFNNDFIKKSFEIRFTDFLNPSLMENFISIYKHNKYDFDIKNHEIISKLEAF